MDRRWGLTARMAVLAALGSLLAVPARASQPACHKLDLHGEVKAGQSWRASIGDGWTIRLVPIVPGPSHYSGWDLVVEPGPAGYPDALLLATPPYNSIGAREIGTTFGLRAQDALGWTPRSFRFFTDRTALQQARQLFSRLGADRQPAASTTPANGPAMEQLMQLLKQSAAGELRIDDAGLTLGASDAAPFAESWAIAFPRTPHTVEPPVGGAATPRGELHWLRFSVTLWLPEAWTLPNGVLATAVPCR